MIHVCFSLHDKLGTYSKFTGTTICSIFENTTSDVTVHILHDNTLTPDNRDKFIYLAGRYGQAVKFYNVAELCADKIREITALSSEDSRLTVGALYRLFVPLILPNTVDKIIYLDSDIIVNLDIKEIWQVDLGDKILAAVPEILTFKTPAAMKPGFPLCADDIVKCEDYFNSGVLLIDLKILRGEEDTIMNGAKFTSKYYWFGGYGDQDILNYCFSKRALKLPIKFNRFISYARRNKELASAGKIYHYSGGSLGLGLGLDLDDSFNRLWMNYFVKTPWFDGDTIGRLCNGFNQMNIAQKNFALNLSAAVSGKTRTFVAMEDDINTFFENIPVRNDEEVIAVKSDLPLQKLIDIMNASRGKKIFFIMLPNFPFNILQQAGFLHGGDFVDAYNLLTKADILRIDSYTLLKKM
ncbi:MAG: hypothetical protein II857_09535 [Selenomonadaceae bacterium]|nr:hypothetical protein [Selenomonadaceae bacterium]